MIRGGAKFLFLLMALALPWVSFPFAPAHAAEAVLSIDLAEDHVDITTGFTGSRVVLFGIKETPGDVAVTISGPDRKMVVRRKEQVFGLWINRKSAEFLDVPVYYDYALSRPEKDIAPLEILRENGIGLDALAFEPVWERDPEETARFQEGLIRNRQALGLYPLEPRSVEFPGGNLFRATFQLPANVPTGEYVVRAFLIRDKKILEMQKATLSVAQIGFLARVFNFAYASGWLYGLCAVLLAVLAGWAAHTFLRRE